jgi:hypothetical protein
LEALVHHQFSATLKFEQIRNTPKTLRPVAQFKNSLAGGVTGKIKRIVNAWDMDETD